MDNKNLFLSGNMTEKSDDDMERNKDTSNKTSELSPVFINHKYCLYNLQPPTA